MVTSLRLLDSESAGTRDPMAREVAGAPEHRTWHRLSAPPAAAALSSLRGSEKTVHVEP
jgi:hypothetical protein